EKQFQETDMRLAIISAAAAALASLAQVGPAAAQVGFGVYVGPSSAYDEYDYTSPAYRTGPYTYGYSSTYRYDEPEVIVRGPARRNGCGEYFYWNGRECVDARSAPPDLR